MVDFDYDRHRFGFAEFGKSETAAAGGLHDAPTGLFLGFDNANKICRSRQQAPVLLCGGARSGKGNHIIPWFVDGAIDDHVISMDWKSQNGSISHLQHDPTVRIINWAPRGSNFPTNRINPVSYLKRESKRLVADAKLFTQSWIPLNGSKEGEYFQATAQRFLEACVVHYAEKYGEVDLPGLADLMSVFATEVQDWVDFEQSMALESDYSFIQSIALELVTLRKSDNPNAGGFAGAKGEILKSFSCMTDPQIREVVRPPFDFCFSELTERNAPRTQVNVQEAMEYAQTSAPIVKALYTCALVYKRRSLRSRPQLWVLDEIGNIGAWPLAVELGTYGPGFGIRPIYIVQSVRQIDNLKVGASSILPNSCGTQIYKGIREYSEALRISNMLGHMTLEVTDTVRDQRIRDQIAEKSTEIEFDGADPLLAGMAIENLKAQIGMTTPVQRHLLTPSEITTKLGKHRCILFMPDDLASPMVLNVPDYWTRSDLAGRYLGDIYHDDDGEVSIADGRGGSRKAKVLTEPVPRSRRHLPQHADGLWRYVAGHKPKPS